MTAFSKRYSFSKSTEILFKHYYFSSTVYVRNKANKLIPPEKCNKIHTHAHIKCKAIKLKLEFIEKRLIEEYSKNCLLIENAENMANNL